MCIRDSFNNEHALPNKFFEFIQARLAIAIGPSTEMQKIVKKEGLGIVAKDFSLAAMAEELNSLQASDIARYKVSAHQNAKKYSADASAEIVRASVQRALVKVTNTVSAADSHTHSETTLAKIT